MSKILSIKPITTKVGKPLILVTTVADGDVYVPYGSWVSGKKYSEVLDSYVGGEFHADFYAEGEELLDGTKFEARNGTRILRDFTAAMNPVVAALLAHQSLKAQSDSMLEAAAMFRNRRNAAITAKAAATPAGVVSPTQA